jgi:hypothetical protein
MKILILKKKFLVTTILSISLLFLLATLIPFIQNKFKSLQTIAPINISQNKQFDLTGDGIKDTLQILNSQNKIDFSIHSSNDNYYLSSQVDDKILFTTNNHWEPRIFINDISISPKL